MRSAARTRCTGGFFEPMSDFSPEAGVEPARVRLVAPREAMVAPVNGRRDAWLRAAARPSVVRRSLKYAVVVGSVLVAINHGDAIAGGDLSWPRLLRIVGTVLVSYLVTTFASVDAVRSSGGPPS